MEIHFHIDENSIKALTWEEYEAFEQAQDGDMKLYRLRPVLARFVIGENGNKPLPHRKAMQVLGALPLSEMPNIIETFVNAIRDGVIPKENGSPSNSPLEADQADSVSPAGSES